MFPRPSRPTCGRSTPWPGSDSVCVACQAPPCDRTLASATQREPLNEIQIAAALPAASSATQGNVTSPVAERSWPGSCQGPPGERAAQRMTESIPVDCDQTAIAFPPGSIPTCGLKALRPTADRSCAGSCQEPPSRRTAACTISFTPLERVQIAIAFPAPSTTTFGLAAPTAERSVAGCQGSPAGLAAP